MNLELKLLQLEGKDNSKAYEVLKELENFSENSNELYPYINQFIKMIYSEKYVMRVRGFRLFCKQAQWDKDNIIDENIDEVLNTLYEEKKPTALRQDLAALKEVVLYKKELQGLIKEKVMKIDYLKYKETMHKLIEKDIEDLLSLMD